MNEENQCCLLKRFSKIECAGLLVLCAFVLFAIEEFFSHDWNQVRDDHKRLASVAANTAAYENTIDELRKEISNLKKEISEQRNFYQRFLLQKESRVNNDYRRRKWKVWIDLKNKIENEENCEREFQVFCNEFSNDTELLALIRELLEGVDVITTGNNNDGIDAYKKYIKKIVRIKKIDYKKLLDISGYVLSSIDRRVEHQ